LSSNWSATACGCILDFGGGLGIAYRDETRLRSGSGWARSGAASMRGATRQGAAGSSRQSLVGPPGRLFVRVIGLKGGVGGNFAVVDAAMNDQLRPALYEAWMDVSRSRSEPLPGRTTMRTGLRKQRHGWRRERPLAIEAGDVLAMLSLAPMNEHGEHLYSAPPPK